jgi:hypothetical protein
MRAEESVERNVKINPRHMELPLSSGVVTSVGKK